MSNIFKLVLAKSVDSLQDYVKFKKPSNKRATYQSSKREKDQQNYFPGIRENTI